MLANYIFELDPVLFSEKPRSGTHLFVSEILATFGLLMVILLSAKEKVAVTVAAYIGAAYWFTSSTSFANPAGTIGRSFSNTFAGISAHDILHFCVAQIIGAFLALIVYRTFFESQK
jgi:glycerol uptake facilitator-like aquaporin